MILGTEISKMNTDHTKKTFNEIVIRYEQLSADSTRDLQLKDLKNSGFHGDCNIYVIAMVQYRNHFMTVVCAAGNAKKKHTASVLCCNSVSRQTFNILMISVWRA